jgi:Sigma-70, region 4
MPSALHTIEGLQAAEAYRCMSLDDHVSGWAAGGEVIGSLDHALARIDDRETLRPLLAQLPSRDRTILALRFFHQLTQTQIAEQVGVSQMQSRERSAKPCIPPRAHVRLTAPAVLRRPAGLVGALTCPDGSEEVVYGLELRLDRAA